MSKPTPLMALLRERCWTCVLLVSLALAACSTVPPSNVRSNAKLTPTSQITRDLSRLPRPAVRVPVAVYGFRDQTGQYKSAPESAYSTLVTQGAASILMKALEDSGWFVPVEREGLQNLLTERRIVRAVESPTDKGKPVINLPNMTPASLIIEGGVIAYESNVRTGGKGASYLGIGASTQYRVDQVTVGLRNVDVRTGQVLTTVSVTKTIYSTQFSASLYKYVDYQKLLQAETGFTTNEPAQLAVREAVESAVLHLTAFGIRDRYLELQDPGEWDHPVVQAALAEALANIGEPLPADNAPVPLRPMLAECDAVIRPLAGEDPAAASRSAAGRAALLRPCLNPVAPPRPVPAEPDPAEREVSVPPPAPVPAVRTVPPPPAPPAAAPTPAPQTVPQAEKPVAQPAAQPVPRPTPVPISPLTVPAASSVAAPAPVLQPASAPARATAPPPAPPTASQAAPSPVPARVVPVADAASAPASVPRAQPLPRSPAAAASGASAPVGDIFNQYWKSR
jgi:curli production assembly/transport component CsgG